MNYDNTNTCVAHVLTNVRGSLWFNDGPNPEKDIEIKDMDSNLVHYGMPKKSWKRFCDSKNAIKQRRENKEAKKNRFKKDNT